MKYWTYNTKLDGSMQDEIDNAVAQGWELVSCGVEPIVLAGRAEIWLRRWIWRRPE